MFARFKKRSIRQGCVLDVVLVESRWIGGRAREKFIKHLKSIRVRSLDCDYSRSRFWQVVDRRLRVLVPDAGSRLRIEGQIARRVSRPKEHEPSR